MTERRIAIIIDADGKAGVAAFDATTGAAEGLGAAMDDLNVKAKRSGEEADKTGKKWEEAGKKVGLVVAAAVTGFAVLVGHQIKVADEAGKLAAKVGVSTDFISEMGYAAKATGADAAILESGLFGLGDAAVKAEAGVKRPAAAFKALGIDVTDARGQIKSMELLLPEVADKFQKMKDGPKEAALATVLFGSAAKDLLPLLNEGADGMEELRAKARELGLTVSDEAAAAAAEFNDQVDLVKAQVTGAAIQIAQAYLPAINELTRDTLTGAEAQSRIGGVTAATIAVFDLFGDAIDITGRAVQSLTILLGNGVDQMAGYLQLAKQISTFGAADGTMQDALDRMGVSKATARDMLGEIWDAPYFSDNRKALAERPDFSNVVGNPTRKKKSGDWDPDTSRVFNTSNADSEKRKRDADRQLEAQRKYREELERLEAELAGPLAEATTEHQQRLEHLEAEYKKGNITLDVRDKLMKVADQQYAKTTRELLALQDIEQQIHDDYETEIRLAGLSNEQRRVEEELIRRVNDAKKAGLSEAEIEARKDAMRAEIELGERAKEAAEAQAQYARDVQNAWIGAATSMTRAFGDFFANGLRDGKGFVRSLKDIFKSLVSDLVTMFLDNSLVKPFQSWLQGALSGSSSSSMASQQGGLLSGFGNIVNSGFDKLLSGIGSLFGFGGQASAGIQTAVHEGMHAAQAAGATGTSAASGATGAMGAFAKVIPVLGWIYAGMQLNGGLYDGGWKIGAHGNFMDSMKGSAMTGDFGLLATTFASGTLDDLLQRLGVSGKWASMLSGSSVIARLFGMGDPKITGSGITGSYGFDGFSGQSYADIKQKGGLFRSDKKWTEYAVLDSELDAAFDSAAKAVNRAAVKLASQAGMDISAQLAAVHISIGKLQLSSDAEEAKAQLEAALNQMIENLSAKAVEAMGFSQLLDDGYGATEVMSALSVAIHLVTGSTDALGRSLTALEIEKVALGVEYFERMAEISGSTLAEEMERIVGLIQDYSTLMSGVRRDIVTHDLNDYQRAQLDVELQYRSLIDQANELAKAMGLSGARAEDLAAIEQWRALQMADLAEQYQQMVEDQRASFLASLGLSDLSPLRDDQKLLEAMQLLQDAASAGDWDSAQKYAQQVLGLGRNLYASGEDYTDLYDQVVDILNGMSTEAEQQDGLSTSELQRIADLLEGQPNAIAQALFDLLIAPTSEPETPTTGSSGTTGTSGGSGGSAGSGSTTGGGGGGYEEPSCVAYDQFLDDWTRAIDATPGAQYCTHAPQAGFGKAPLQRMGAPVLQPCVRLVTVSGAALVCSRSTPFTAPCAPADAPEYTTLAPDMLGRAVYVQRLQGTRFEVAIESVVDVQDVGDREVIPLDFGGRSFPAGESRDALIFSHNMQKTNDTWMTSEVALRMVAGIESIAATNAAMAQTDQTRAMDELAGSTRTGR